MVRLSNEHGSPLIPSVVVVDPRFDAYKSLVTAARSGQLDLHLRARGQEALALARRLHVDAWLVAAELDDMAGDDFVALLDALPGRRGEQAVAVVDAAPPAAEASHLGGSPVFQHPISMADLEQILRLPADERVSRLPAGVAVRRGIVTLPVGIGAAVVALAVLMMG
jgi:CheY-like chemotaxis protein